MYRRILKEIKYIELIKFKHLHHSAFLTVNNSPAIVTGKRDSLKQQTLETPLLPSEIEEKELSELNQTLLSSPNVISLLEDFVHHESKFEISHYLSTIRRLSELCADSSVSFDSIKLSSVFQQICYKIWRKCPVMEANEVLSMYCYLQNLRVPGESLIMQSLLQMTRHQINLLNLKELMFLHRLLSKNVHCKLTSALEEAIPVAIESIINSRFPSHLSHGQMSQLLNVCVAYRMKNIDLVIRHICDNRVPDLIRSEDPASTSSGASFLINLLDIFSAEESSVATLKSEPLCSTLAENDLETVHLSIVRLLELLAEKEFCGLDKRMIVMVLNKLATGLQSGLLSNSLYEGFIEKLTQKALKDGWPVSHLLSLADVQLRMNFVMEELLVALLLKSKSIISNSDTNLIPFVSALASSNLRLDDNNQVSNDTRYSSNENNVNDEKSELSDKGNLKDTDHILDHQIVSRLMENTVLDFGNLKIPWLRVCLNLVSLNCYSERIFDVVLKEEFLSRYMNFRRWAPRDKLDLLRLDRSLKSFCPNTKWRVPESLTKGVRPNSSPPSPELKELLRFAAGDSNYIASGVISNEGNEIDHLIYVNCDGRMVKIECLTSEGSDSEILHEEKEDTIRKLAIIEIPNSWCCRPGLKIRGYFKPHLRLVEKEGFEVLPIFQEELERLPEEEVLNYVKEKLRHVGIKM